MPALQISVGDGSLGLHRAVGDHLPDPGLICSTGKKRGGKRGLKGSRDEPMTWPAFIFRYIKDSGALLTYYHSFPLISSKTNK